ERGRTIASAIGHALLGVANTPERLRDFRNRKTPDFPLIEHMDGEISGLPRPVPAAGGLNHAGPPGRPSPSRASSVAISTLAIAASQPLLPGPVGTRASASSAEFVVRTPNAIGTPVAAAACVSPWETA